MKPCRSRGWFSRMTAALVSAALVVSAFAPGSAALAAEVRVGAAPEGRASVPPSVSVQSLSLASSLTGSALSPLSPALPSAPSAAAPLPGALGGHARPLAAVAAPALVPSAAPVMAPAPAAAAAPAGPIARAEAWLSRAAGLPAAKPSGVETSGAAKTRADAEFRKLTGERAAERPELAAAADGPDDGVAGAPSAAEPALAPSEPALPRSWRKLPSEAREAEPAALVAAKAAAQERARRLAPDARLVKVAINLEDSRSHWIFVFRSDAKRQELTVWTKRVAVRRLGFRAPKAPTLHEPRLAAMGRLDSAYAALKAASPAFRPVRVEVDPAWTGPASYRFLDAFGRAAAVKTGGAVVLPAAPLALNPSAKAPPSFSRLPADARGADGAGLLALKREAQERARRIAPDARLVRAAINLDDPRSHWTFVFRSDAKRQELTVWTRKIGIRRLAPNARRVPTLWDARLEAASSVAAAYAALKAAKPGLKPLRVELVPSAKGPAKWSFLDARGRETSVEAMERAAPAPAAETPAPIALPAPAAEVPAPAAETPAPAAETPAPAAEIPVPPAETPAPPAASPKTPESPAKYIFEDFLGFRTVRGVTRDPKLGRLPANAGVARIIDQISGQFGIPREEVLASAAKFRLDETGTRQAWLAVYDRLQAANRDHFKRFDQKKYEGWSSFRQLANRSYPKGWRGALLRASELHKAFIGFTIRFPYHLFDMFLFGYFRQAISFEFFHSGEDFLSLAKEKDMARKWLDASLRDQGHYGAGNMDGLRSRVWFRQAERWFLVPLAKPLTTFLVRRLTLAVMSAVAMGLLGAFAPALPLSFALTSLPLLGPGIVWALNGLPVAAAAIPFVGHFLAPVVAATVGALAKDLVLGPLLNTMILSTLLTFPNAARERLAAERDKHPTVALTAGEWARAVAGTAATWSFWRMNLKSFFGLATVGAEIAGIMTYAGSIDSVVDPGFKAAHTLGGHHAGFFEMIGAAVERPKGESSIPFGGAITWGSVLLSKLQDATGFHISEAVMGAALGAKSLVGAEGGADGMHAPAAAVVHAASTREGAKTPFDPNLWKMTPAEAAARIKELAATAGGLDAELAAVKTQMTKVRASLGDDQARLKRLEQLSHPVTPAEKAEYESLLKQLAVKRDQSFVESKLAQRHDLLAGAKKDPGEELRQLKALRDRYYKGLPPPPPDRNGYWDELATQEASYRALSVRLNAQLKGGAGGPDAVPVSPIKPELRDAIEKVIGEIENQRAEVQAEMTERDATQNLLRAANQIRNHALHERRNGQDMLRFHTDFAKLATVMDLALSLNEIAAAQAAIKQMMDLLEAKRAAIAASQQQNQQGQQSSSANQANVAQWKADAQKAVDGDDSSKRDLTDLEGEASMAASRSAGFQQQISALIAAINASDKAGSPDALTEYNRRIALLPQIAQWRTNGNPNDPNAFSLKSFNDDLAQVNDNLQKAQAGLAQLQPAPPDEYAGVVMLAVPGPAVAVTNATKAQTLQILSDRRTYWQDQKASYQKNLDSVNRMMDPSNSATVTDEFGDAHPESLPRWKSQASGDLSASQTALHGELAQLDAIAAELNGMTGSAVPMLSGLSLKDLQAAIKTYGDALKAVKFPSGTDTPATHKAKMDLILAAQLTPYAAREVIRSSYDQAVVDQITSALATTLPVAQQGLQGIQNMMNSILSDVDQDTAFVNGGGESPSAVIARKTALLRDTIIPALQSAKTMLTGTLIPYQQDSVNGITKPDGDYFTLYDGKRTLMTQTQDLYNKTLPWALASFGGSVDDKAGSLASISSWKASLQKYIDGYDDATGHHEGITEYQKDMVDRQCASGCTRTETLYGESQPYSLPQKISQYGTEEAARAQQINAEDAQINEILTKIQTLSGGKYDLSSYLLPTGVGTDAASVAKVQAVVDATTIPNLGDKLKEIANAENTGAGLTIDAGGSGTVPTGTQPSPTISNGTQIALLALDAAKRLVPSSLDQPASAPAAYAVARFLYSDAVVAAAKDALTNQVPQAVTFLQHASQSLGNAISQTDQDVAFVNSNGSSETPDALYARKVAMFQSLDAFLTEGMQFYGLKKTWDQSSFGTIDKINTYYDSLNTIYTKGSTVNDNEITALNTMEKALQDTYNSLDATKQKVTSWMSQLDPKEQSALNRVSDDVSKIQDKTRAVLEANISWHDLEDQLARSRTIVAADLAKMDDKQRELAKLLDQPGVQDGLPAKDVRRIEALRMGRGAWAMGGAGDQTQALVVKKSEYSAFLDTILGMLTQGSQQLAHQDVSAIKGDLLKNPQGLAAFIPGSSVMDFGDNADGFYLVYQSKFSVPNGLETGSWVTLGNVAQLWGNNVSVNGYAFSSPPSSGGQNAPYGDKGVEVQVESLQNRSSVNYLNVDLHRFGFDIPADNSVAANAAESRLMVFDDYAMMMMNGKLYVGLAGYGDMALNKPGEHPYYYGGNAKTSLKLTEVMSLNASQQELFAKDPRQFLENVNLDFTGYDPSLNQNFAITAQGANKYYSRTQVGPSFDVNRLLHPDGGGDTFTVDLFYAKTAGTDDINQQSLGATVLKGFSIKNDAGKTWLRIDNRLTGEAGQQANKLGDRLSFTLPDSGITLSGEGQIIGGQSTHYAEISKKTGDNTNISLGYGSQYIGQPDRLSITMNTSFTLAQLWQAVADNSGQALQGGQTLKEYNAQLSDFFAKESKNSATVAELSRVFEQDVGRKLVSQDIGVLTKDISDLRKAGAFMDNTRVRGMVGFTSRAVSNDTAELAVGGGFTVGTYTEMTLTKTQKSLVADKSVSLYREGMRLQDRLLQITKDWQEAVVELAQAQWDLKLANFEVANAPSEAVRASAAVRAAAALDRVHQALLRYNAMTGRDATAESPLADLNASDLQALMANIRGLITAPDRYEKILGQLDRAALAKQLGPDPVNVMDWIPWIEKFSLGFGVQYQDMMANQALTVGASVRLPVYDPASKSVDHAYVMETSAFEHEMAAAFQERALRISGERERALAWKASADAVAPQGPAAAQRLSDAIRAYRNGLIGPDAMRAAFDSWRWYAQTTLQAESNASLAEAQAAVDAPMASKTPLPDGPARITSLDDAFALAVSNAQNLKEVADRSNAAEEMARAENHRVQKFWVDLGVGTGLTAKGLGWIPSIGITGIPVTPVFGFELKPEEMRELQVQQHANQKEYYDALKTRLEAGLAVQFYQNVVGFRSAQARLGLYDQEVLPALAAAAAGGDADAIRKLDEARLGRAQTALALGQSRSTLNLLLGRDASAPLEIAMDEQQALVALSRLLTAKPVVATQRAILDARVKTARAVEGMVDANQKVDILQLEPVSLVVRSLGRLVAALGDGPVYNPDAAAAARISVLNEERAREAYDGQRADQAAGLRSQLNARRAELSAIASKTDPDSELKKNELSAAVFSLEAGLLAIGENPDRAPVSPDAPKGMPSSWAEARRRLSSAEQALSPSPSSDPPDIPNPEVQTQRSGAYMRYYYANQTLGHEPIKKSFVEGWIEVRLKDPNTPPEVLLALAKLRDDKALRIYKTQLVGAASKADVLSSQFEADVRLQRWLDRQGPTATGLDSFRTDLAKRLDGERDRIVSLLGLPPATDLKSLEALVPEDLSPKAGLGDQASELIDSIRKRQVESVRRTLFEDGLPAEFGSEDDLMNQIKANTIAERMSYKGFTPVAAAGIFRGQSISGVFLEAPDPRTIEKALENVMSDVLRKQLESDGRLKELSLHLNQLMSQVSDGAVELEAQRHEIEAAEGDLRARTALAGADAPETARAEQRLLDAWARFSKTMVDTKSSFITLVTELEALGQGSTGTLRPFAAPPRYEPRSLRRDSRDELLDFWTERMKDARFEEDSDALLARTGAGVPPDARAAIRAAAAAYRQALTDADAVRGGGFDAAESLSLQIKIDVEGKRLVLREALQRAVPGLSAMDPRSNSVPAEILSFFRDEAGRAADAGALDRGQKRAIAGELRETFWHATAPSPAAEAAFRRLEPLEKAMDDARELLMTSYLADAKGDPNAFVLKDLELDGFLKAQAAYDAEILADLRSPDFDKDPAMQEVLDGLHDVRASLDRSVASAQFGRGMAALDALIMLDQTRLRAARWGGRTPVEIDRIAESLQNLKSIKARWEKGAVGPDELSPLYAVTRLDGDKRTWTVDQWMTKAEVENLLLPEGAPAKPGAIVQRGGRLFVDDAVDADGKPTGVRYELIGGVDAASALRDDSGKAVADNRAAADLSASMSRSDFVAVGPAPEKTAGYAFPEVFGPNGLYAQGRVLFFDAAKGVALHPLLALSRPPEEVVMMLYGGDEALSRDRFPTLKSLQDSDQAGAFRRLAVSPSGAAALQENARNYEDAQLRRGWVEVKLNSFGFARDADGRVSQLYRTQDDFQAQWKAFRNAEGDLRDARAALAAAKAAEADRKSELDAAQGAYQAAQYQYNASRRSDAALEAAARLQKAADAVQNDPAGAVGAVKAEYDAAVRHQKEVLASLPGQKEFDRASKPFKEATDKYRLAQAQTVVAQKAVTEQERTLARSKTWTLYRTSDLDLGLDAGRRIVTVSAPAALAPAAGTAPAFAAVPGGGPAESHLTGDLAAAVVDENGLILRAYGSESQVDAASRNWSLTSYSTDGDVSAKVGDGQAATKVRLSHYEETLAGPDGKTESLPVLLSERYLIERLDASKSRLSTANHWAIMPYNWGNIVLEIPRGIVQAPIELIGGRDPNSQHYLGRAMMYKTEGGETEHHGFFRTVLGWVDVLDLLPDPVARYYDPSQFPDRVQIASPLSPGRILADLKPRDRRGDKTYDVKFGKVAMAREARQAAEDLDAARERTLARFNGGVEETTLATLRGRGHETPDHQWSNQSLESSLRVRSGRVTVDGKDESVVDRTLTENALVAADGKSDGTGGRDVVASATPGSLFVDRVEVRTRIYPGASGYEAQARAMDGYAGRVRERDRAVADARPGLDAALARNDALFKGRLEERERVAREENRLWTDWHELAERIGAQRELERRMDALRAEIAGLQRELAGWTNYASALEAARRGDGPVVPGRPGDPRLPGPGAFWAFILALFGLGSLLAAAWYAWREGVARRSRPA